MKENSKFNNQKRSDLICTVYEMHPVYFSPPKIPMD